METQTGCVRYFVPFSWWIPNGDNETISRIIKRLLKQGDKTYLNNRGYLSNKGYLSRLLKQSDKLTHEVQNLLEQSNKNGLYL